MQQKGQEERTEERQRGESRHRKEEAVDWQQVRGHGEEGGSPAVTLPAEMPLALSSPPSLTLFASISAFFKSS